MNKDLASKIDSIRVLGPGDEIAHLDAELKAAEKRIAELESVLRAIMAHYVTSTARSEELHEQALAALKGPRP